MASGAPTLRIPFILLSTANLAVLGLRLWPWQEVVSLPGNGTTAFDPAIALLGYIGLIFFMTDNRKEPGPDPMSTGTMMGLLAGAVLVAQVLLQARTAIESSSI